MPTRDTAPARTTLLAGPLGLAERLARGTAYGWALGLGAAAFVFGLVARAAAEATTTGAAGQIFERLGRGASGPRPTWG